jgi:hypothetical protein
VQYSNEHSDLPVTSLDLDVFIIFTAEPSPLAKETEHELMFEYEILDSMHVSKQKAPEPFDGFCGGLHQNELNCSRKVSFDH